MSFSPNGLAAVEISFPTTTTLFTILFSSISQNVPYYDKVKVPDTLNVATLHPPGVIEV